MQFKMGKQQSLLDFLNENAIQNKPCNLQKPFVFLSYSHANHDAIIVQNVFEMLNVLGFNAWIDVANIPYDQKSWQEAAFKALNSENCKAFVYFRSEDSMTKEAVADEVELINRNGYARLITADIWTDPKMTAQTVLNNLQKDSIRFSEDDGEDAGFKACSRICKIIDPNNSAIRLAHECHNDSIALVKKIAEQLINCGLDNGSKKVGHDEDFDFDFVEKDGKTVRLSRSENPEDVKLREFADVANEEIERNAKEFRNNDFGLLASNLKKMIPGIKSIEEKYQDLAKIYDKKKALQRNIIFRRDIIFRIFLISFVSLSVIGVFADTIQGSLLYRIVHGHVENMRIVTQLFYQAEDESIRAFFNVIISAMVDAAEITALSTLLPALVKSVIIGVYKVKIAFGERECESLIKEKIVPLENFPLTYMCSFAMGYFIRVHASREAKTVEEAMSLFDDYKNSDKGVIEVAKIASFLHYMRAGINRVFS